MSGQSPNPGFIEFYALRDGINTRYGIDIVFDDQIDYIEARMFWFNTANNVWVREDATNTRIICVPQSVVNAGGPEAMCKILVDFYNDVLRQLWPATEPASPFPPHSDPDGLVNATRNLFIAHRVVMVDGQLTVVKP